ncbi:DUF4233 domain-containing protein [Cellulomonas fimi]|uniref:DUF4233 domain-containing protein n=1 Tax=Cellulomonas fimi TaxID=1708 RepID=A0A7Y0QHX0_CELFI|nr:DUF4233 domain-containing protein [Cellulomonas fimi]NMR19607.1 DUF4233 domain-containing protein [Cellulomonas fimi]
MTTPQSDVPAGAARRRSARRTFAATTLVLEAFVVLFATAMAYALRAAPGSVVWAIGGTLSIVLLLLSGMLRSPGGYVAGSIVQVLLLLGGVALLVAPVEAAGFVGTMTLVVAGVFVALWVTGLRLGARIDREKADWDAAHPVGQG